MNTDQLVQIVGAIFAITIIEIPLIISSWLLVKSTLVKINRIRSLTYSDHDRKKDIVTVITLSIGIIMLFFLIIPPIVIGIAPELFFSLPLELRLFLTFGFMIIYAPIYACFFALFRGLGDAVGAGGSASNVIKQLQRYIYEVLEINQEKK